MKIAVFSPLATVAPHFETELEIIQRHLDNGDEVDVVSCTGKLANCDFNTSHNQSTCDDCLGRRQHGLRLLEPSVKLLSLHGITPSRVAGLQTTFSSVEELKAYRFEEFDVGYAALSSLVSICRNPTPDLNEHRTVLTALIESALATYIQTKDYIQSKIPDRVYVFNGRFAATRAVLRACEALNIDCCLHERGCDTNHYQLFENKLPHDIGYMQQRMEQAWNTADPTGRVTDATAWFHDRINRVERNWHSFVKDQTRGQLPENWDPNKRNISIFTSSEDEFVSIGDCWKNPLYKNQLDGLVRTVQDLALVNDNIHLYVRIHPNLATVDDNCLEGLFQLSGSRVTVLPPNDATDSYDLMRHSEKVVTFGSSIGIEAVFWDRPSILLGQCFYRDLGGVYQPNSHESFMELLNEQLKPRDKSSALMYGHWFQTHGTRYKYFQADDLFTGKFKGQVVFAQPKHSLARKLRRKIESIFQPNKRAA